VRLPSGEEALVPSEWALLPPGDATLTRRVKAAGPSWTVQEKRGRKVFSLGVWAPAVHITDAKKALETEREPPAYQKRLASGRKRQGEHQARYVGDFRTAVLEFLDFDAGCRELADQLADAVTSHATPVGSGTVARTQRIPVERRAEAAVIAWMRHQTTAYDDLSIPRIKGARREARRMLAERSRRLLEVYRRGGSTDSTTCPLVKALHRGSAPHS